MEKGHISVQTENIFPIIKKFLYSDHEIFLRELVSNAVDATKKIKGLAQLGEYQNDLGDLTIKVSIDKDAKTITISDSGIGMTAEEVKKYINQIAFSSANEFIEKFKDVDDAKSIIGHFGLGFYSAFMVAHTVEIQTRSYKDEPAVKWTCDGSTEYSLEEIEKSERGTTIILHVNEDSEEFLEEGRISGLLKKYCRFLPVPIQFGEKYLSEEDKKEGKEAEANIINITEPIWVKSPSGLTDEDYLEFYRELYPMANDPLFWIHLNVDYPFNLTGILYFPPLNKTYEVQKDKIQLYSNQVFVTNNVEEIVPEYLTLLHGVIDSPDIPLNVSRSYLQADGNVKKINQHISKKVSDKLAEIFKNDRTSFEEKWADISIFVKYGMLSDDKFYDRSKNFCLLKSTANKLYTLEEYKEFIKDNQTDKNESLVILYTNSEIEQHAYIKKANEKSYDVVVMDSIIDNHFIQLLESKFEKTQFKRVDADTLDKLIEKDTAYESVLTQEQQDNLKQIFENQVSKDTTTVEMKSLSPDDAPVTITKNEFMRRMQEMSKMGGGGGMMMFGDMPERINIAVNTNHPISQKILNAADADKNKIAKQLTDLALLSQGMLKGEALTDFVERSVGIITQ
ncbi:MAG: molecular chaperone HtpG [Chitinophagales bacterium]|nr:molecular chaperone HtpG [Chitinophagales bacterium]